MFWRSAERCQEIFLTYKPGTTRSQLREVKNKKLLCESLTYGDLNDYSKLYQLLHIKKHEFYTVCIDPDSAALKCIDFLKDCAAKGYVNFISVVEYEPQQPGDQMVYGNHYIIVCDKKCEVERQLKSLRDRRPVYSTKSYPCIVLKNYMYETQDKLERVLNKLSIDNLRDTIELGRFVRPSSRNEISNEQFDKIVNVETYFLNDRRDQVNAEATFTWQIKGLTTDKPVNFAVCKNTITLIRQPQEAKATMQLKQLTSDKCEATVVAVSQQPQIPWSSCLTLPAKPQITIMVIGRSNQNNFNLINSVTSGKAHDGIVNYGSYNMKLVSVVPDTTPLDLSLHQTIHGFIFMMENRVSPIPFISEKDLRSLLEIVPRSAAKNCCIINCFTPNASLTLAEASNQLSKFIDAFCKVHELKCRISHFCIDKSAVLNHQEHALPNDASNLIKSKIEDFILPITHSPVSRNELKIVECLKKLGDILNRKQIQNDGNVDRLMASIADRTMSDTALYFRKHLKTALPLPDNEWKTAVNSKIDDDLKEIVREIGSYLKAEESSALEILKSKSIFDMLADSEEHITQVNANFSGHDGVVDEPTPSTNPKLTQGNKSITELKTETSTAVPSKNVLIVGSSAPKKQLLLNCVKCVRQHENFDDAVNNVALMTLQDSNEYVVDYGTHTICYISRDELGIEEFDIHGCIIVVENNTMELSNATDNHIRNTFSRLPRRAVENCCIVNTFTPSDTFGMNDAEQQMHELVIKFCGQHALANEPAFICIDAVAMEAILDHNAPSDSNVYRSAYVASQRGFKQFLQTIQTVEPITPADLEISANWARLCEAFRAHIRNRDEETRRLMATIAENCLTGLAIYCRKNNGGALPLRDDEWPTALCYWNSKDDKVDAFLQKLNNL